MVTINTTDDLLRALDENPRWQEAVRHRILTEELMRLPARFDRFVAVTEAFMEEQRQVNANTAEFIDEQRRVNAEQRQINAEQRETNARMEGHIARIDNAMDRIREDIGTMKADHARTNTAREARGIAYNMGFQLVRTLSYDDLLALEIAGGAADLSRGERESFRRADLVMEVAAEDGTTHYIALEVSFTGDERDTSRALRNAELLTRFTGHPARAAIASVRNVYEIQPLIDSGEVYWHGLDDRRPRVED